jgi:hypothetical protein
MQQQPQYAPALPTNTMAIVSLVSAILSWFVFPIIGAIVAVITGHMARREIRESYGAQTGDGLAVAGLVIGYLNLALSCLSLVFVLLMFGGVISLGACVSLGEASGFVPSNITIPPIPAG